MGGGSVEHLESERLGGELLAVDTHGNRWNLIVAWRVRAYGIGACQGDNRLAAIHLDLPTLVASLDDEVFHFGQLDLVDPAAGDGEGQQGTVAGRHAIAV